MAKRRVTPYTAVAVAGAVLLTGAAAWCVLGYPEKPKRRTRKKTKKSSNPGKLQCDPSPYTFVPDRVIEMIDTHIAQGEFDKAFIAQDVAYQLFGEHPHAGRVSFPPQPDAPAGVDCVWGLVALLVDGYVPEVEPEEEATPELVWTVHMPDDPGYPWEEPAVHPDNIPVPGLFVDAGHGNVDGVDDLVVVALSNAFWMAGLDPDLASANNSTAKRLRREFRGLVTSCPFNQQLYGQTDVEKAGGSADRGVTYMMVDGRGLNWDRVHADNMSRIGSGMSPCRTTDSQGVPFASEGEGMLLWVPALDLQALHDRKVQPTQWSDGSSTQEPPPCVQRLGLNLREAAA